MPRKTNLSETPAPRSKAAAPQAAPKRHHKAAAPARLPEVTAQDIARLAYSYWEQRGFFGGSPQADWFRAEHELRSAQSQA